MISKVNPIGPFVEEWKKCLGELSGDVEEVDVSPGLSQALAIKDETELVCTFPYQPSWTLIPANAPILSDWYGKLREPPAA